MNSAQPDPDSPDEFPGERISKVLSRAGVASRRDAERMIAEGRVRVNGVVVTSPALNVVPQDRIAVDDRDIPAPDPLRVWRYHKPAGLVTSARDEVGRATIFDEMPEGMPRVMPVGRLDINSEGLLLLTNDGGVKRRLELPSTAWLRRYRVRVHGEPGEESLAALRAGVTVDGIAYQPMEVQFDRQQGANAWLTVGLREGRNREIRRVMEHLGLKVARLIRISYGPFQLGDLAPGAVEEVRPRVVRDQLGLEVEEIEAPPARGARAVLTAEERRAGKARVQRKPVVGGRARKAEEPADMPGSRRHAKGGDDRPRKAAKADDRPMRSADDSAPRKRAAPTRAYAGEARPTRGDGREGPIRRDSPRADRPRGERTGDGGPRGPRPEGGRPQGDRPQRDGPRSGGPRADRPRDDRQGTGGARDWAPRGDRPRDDGRRAGGPRYGKATDAAPRGDRPRDDRPRDDRPRSFGPRGGKPGPGAPRDAKAGGWTPRGDRPHSDDRPRGDAPRGGGARHGKAADGVPRDDRPRDDRPRDDRPRDDRPRSYGPKGDRPRTGAPHGKGPPHKGGGRGDGPRGGPPKGPHRGPPKGSGRK